MSGPSALSVLSAPPPLSQQGGAAVPAELAVWLTAAFEPHKVRTPRSRRLLCSVAAGVGSAAACTALRASPTHSSMLATACCSVVLSSFVCCCRRELRRALNLLLVAADPGAAAAPCRLLMTPRQGAAWDTSMSTTRSRQPMSRFFVAMWPPIPWSVTAARGWYFRKVGNKRTHTARGAPPGGGYSHLTAVNPFSEGTGQVGRGPVADKGGARRHVDTVAVGWQTEWSDRRDAQGTSSLLQALQRCSSVSV
jgi:hypothetical protein